MNNKYLNKNTSTILKPKTKKEIIDALSSKNKVEIGDLLVKAVIDENIQDIKILLDIDVDLEFKVDGWTPLMWAVNYSTVDIIKMLLDVGANINTQSSDGESVLHMTSNIHDLGLFGLLKKYDR